MFLKKWLNYILGYVNIKVEGYFIERFINICISKKILLWNMKRDKSTILYANVGINEYKRLREVAKKTQSKIKIDSKKGLPFIIYKYRKRKIFIILLFLIVIGLVVISNFIWNIEILGETTISKEEIMQTLYEEGVRTGMLKAKIDTNKIINKIRLNRDDIAWIGMSLEGTNAIIEIKEKSMAPEIINENEYCNIVSNKSGMITKINVQNGTAISKVGDVVKEGTLMVAGFLEGKYTGVRYVHSLAEVEAKVWYSKKEKVYLNQQIQVPTGKTEEKYSVNINNFKINFYKTLSKFKKYDTINESKKIKLFSNFYLPIGVTKITNYEYETKDVTYTEQELTETTTQKLEQDLLQQIVNQDNILNKQVNVYENEGYIEVEVIYEVLENIGVKDKIIF